MENIRIKKGLNIPISGEPIQKINQAKPCSQVALIGYDYVGLKPRLVVEEGEKVKLGQPLFFNKQNPQVPFTSPGSGRIHSINRGEKRIFESIIIDLKGEESIQFPSFSINQIKSLKEKQIKDQLVNSGLWASFRTRPFSKIPNPDTIPNSIFVTATDSQPLAPSAEIIITNSEEDFKIGLSIVAKLTPGTLFLCKSPGPDLNLPSIANLGIALFSGPHPSGNAGTHIHFLDPVGQRKTVWHIGFQDVIAIGRLFTTGNISVERIVSLAGPGIINPRLLKTRIGASIKDLALGESRDKNLRLISGSILSGRTAVDNLSFLGRYHQILSILPEGNERNFLGWLKPGFNAFSLKPVFVSHLFKRKQFPLTTAIHGSLRAIIPIEAYEKVVPLDILPTQLFRSLLSNDMEEAISLGCLELDEEDVALCSFVCPSKIDFGSALRQNLGIIEKEII